MTAGLIRRQSSASSFAGSISAPFVSASRESCYLFLAGVWRRLRRTRAVSGRPLLLELTVPLKEGEGGLLFSLLCRSLRILLFQEFQNALSCGRASLPFGLFSVELSSFLLQQGREFKQTSLTHACSPLPSSLPLLSFDPPPGPHPLAPSFKIPKKCGSFLPSTDFPFGPRYFKPLFCLL